MDNAPDHRLGRALGRWYERAGRPGNQRFSDRMRQDALRLSGSLHDVAEIAERTASPNPLCGLGLLFAAFSFRAREGP
jgi:hypothetical protein